MTNDKLLMDKLVFLLFVIFPFGQIFRFPVYSSITIHFLDAVSLLLVVSFLVQKKEYKFPTFTRPLVSFWVMAAFSLILASFNYNILQVATGALYLIRFIIYSSLYFVVDFFVKNDERNREKLVKSLLIVGASTAIFGLIQYFVFPDARPLREFGWDPHLYRLYGTFLDPAFTGIILVFYLLLVLTESLTEKFNTKRVFQLILGLSALYLTYSRASYLAFLTGLATIFMLKGKRRIFLVVASLFLVTLLLLPRHEGIGSRLERVSTILARTENYKETIEIFNKSPLFGVGFNLYRYVQGANIDSHAGAGADFSLLFVFATAGVIGGLIYIFLWIKVLRQSFKNKNTFEGLLLLGSSAALLVHSIFSNTLFYPWVLVWIGVLWGIKGYR